MLEQLYNDLIQFIQEAPPQAGRPQFITAVVNLDHATAEQAGAFADAWVTSAIDLTILNDGDDFDAMLARARAATLERMMTAAQRVFEVVEQRTDYKITRLQADLVVIDERIAELDRQQANAVLGAAEIEVRFPPSELRDDTVEVLTQGYHMLSAMLAPLHRKCEEVAAEIEFLGGGA